VVIFHSFFDLFDLAVPFLHSAVLSVASVWSVVKNSYAFILPRGPRVLIFSRPFANFCLIMVNKGEKMDDSQRAGGMAFPGWDGIATNSDGSPRMEMGVSYVDLCAIAALNGLLSTRSNEDNLVVVKRNTQSYVRIAYDYGYAMLKERRDRLEAEKNSGAPEA
jgi:hypothetical protein